MRSGADERALAHPSQTATSKLANLAGAAELGSHQDAVEGELLDFRIGDSRASPVSVSTDDDTRNQLGWQLAAWHSTRLRDDCISELAQAVSRSFLARTFPTSVFAPRSLKIVSASSRAATAFSRTPLRWYIVPSPYKVRARS